MITDNERAMLKFAAANIGRTSRTVTGRIDAAIDERFRMRPTCFWMRVLELARHEDAMSAAPIEVGRIRDWQRARSA